MTPSTAPTAPTPTDAANPLLDATGLPAFDRISPEHIAPALDTLLAQAEDALAQVTQPDFPAQWLAISRVLDVATERLGRAWSAITHLHNVADTPPLRAAYTAQLPRMTEFGTRLGSSHELFAKYKAIDAAQLNAEQQRALAHTLQGFVLGGALLAGPNKDRFAQIQEELALAGQTFGEHSMDATDAFEWLADPSDLAGVPADVRHTAQQAASADGHHGRCKLTLKMPCYLPVMQFAHQRSVREVMYRAYVTRASDQAEGDSARARDNAPVVQTLLRLRQEEAQLLGYANYAEVSLVPKMAQSPQQVGDFLHHMAQCARPYALQDLADLTQFAQQNGHEGALQAWDMAYWSERLKESRFSFSEQEVKSHFPAPRVLAGLFRIIESLFDVRIHPDQAPTWHSAVEFYRIERAGHVLGHFYLDQPARTGKQSGAWMDNMQDRWLRPDTGQLQTPVAHLVCNFAQGVDGKPALLTHEDVITLFHEFGHGLHQLLTQVNEHAVSGINGVEWDAVELPSQFMENFCWQWDVLAGMTAHVDTGEPMPRALFDKMLAAKNFQSGLQTLRQVEFSLLDLQLHTHTQTPCDILALHQQVRDQVAVTTPPAYARSVNTFDHIFAGGYAAGYYSYKWAEVLSADAYSAFEEAQAAPTPADAPSAGQRFLQEILERGGSRPALESFVAFRGREPRTDALLRHQGMAQAVSAT